MRKFLFFIFFVVCTMPAFGQADTCSRKLQQASAAFDQGRLDDVVRLLQPCIKQLKKEDQIAAYKLLTLTHLYNNEKGQAQQSMIQFLTLNPEYKINPSIDPHEFINLYNSMRTVPVFLYGITFGGNITYPNVTKRFSLDNSHAERWGYRRVLGYQAGISMEFLLNEYLSIAPETYISGRGYHYNDTILDFAELSFRETQTWIDVPLFFRANYPMRNRTIMPYLEAGITGSLLLNSNVTISRTDQIDEGKRDVPGQPISIGGQRNNLNYALGFGGGIKFKNVFGNGYLTLSARYNFGMINMVDAANRLSNNELIYHYLYLENDFRQNYLTFSLSYLLPHYRPKVLKGYE